MSGARPELPEETHMLAGEYVLGVLEGDEKQAVDRQASLDPQLAHAIAAWERRLAPMLTAVRPVPPPDALWAQIARAKSVALPDRQDWQQPSRVALSAAARARATPAAPRRVPAPRVWPWKLATGASLALAAGLAAIVLMPSPAQHLTGPAAAGREVSLVAVLAQPETGGDPRQDTTAQMASDTGTARLVEPQAATPDAAPAAGRATGFLAAAWPDGTVVLTALAPVPVPAGKALELWIKPPAASAPRSLGMLTPAGREVTLAAAPADGTVLSVSVEPQGGSLTGAPTGRVVYAGTLRLLRR